MKKFIFITTLTPEQFLTPLRKSLFELYLQALQKQSYTNWEAILIGEFAKKDQNITYLRSEAVTKSDKLKVAFEYLSQLEIKPDYIIRLDDDDLISPDLLTRISTLDFDCYSDQYHSYYDITTASTSQQLRHWLPNTIIHKFEHGMAPYGESQLSLFMHDHSQAWHVYYADKKIVWAPKKHPVYLRIISPTTITSKMDPGKAVNYADFDKEEYSRYLKTFGNWKRFSCVDFTMHLDRLIKIWENFSQQRIERKKKSFFNFFK